MKAVVFDMDGVLFDTERVCRDSWVLVSREYGITDMEQVFPLCIGRNALGSQQVVTEHYGEDFPYAEFRKKASDVFWQKIDQEGYPLKKGVKELLTYLREEKWQVGLASSTKRESILRHLEKTGLSDFFQVVVGGDQIIHSKPDPDIYLLACEHLAVPPAETYAIEDSYHGILSAFRAGMKPVMVPDLLPPTQEMRECCEVILEDLLQVMCYLQRKESD